MRRATSSQLSDNDATLPSSSSSRSINSAITSSRSSSKKQSSKASPRKLTLCAGALMFAALCGCIRQYRILSLEPAESRLAATTASRETFETFADIGSSTAQVIDADSIQKQLQPLQDEVTDLKKNLNELFETIHHGKKSDKVSLEFVLYGCVDGRRILMVAPMEGTVHLPNFGSFLSIHISLQICKPMH